MTKSNWKTIPKYARKEINKSGSRANTLGLNFILSGFRAHKIAKRDSESLSRIELEALQQYFTNRFSNSFAIFTFPIAPAFILDYLQKSGFLKSDFVLWPTAIGVLGVGYLINYLLFRSFFQWFQQKRN
ncbi:MAG: hypothetical protein RLZZ06_681 [Actinomycetota bacterium]|jgi:hypothetical protein